MEALESQIKRLQAVSGRVRSPEIKKEATEARVAQIKRVNSSTPHRRIKRSDSDTETESESEDPIKRQRLA